MFEILHYARRLSAAFILAIVFALFVRPVHASGNVIALGDVTEWGCNEQDIRFDVVAVVAEPQEVLLHLVAEAGGIVYTNVEIPFTYEAGITLQGIRLDHIYPSPSPFPIPEFTPIAVTFTVRDAEHYQPIWQTNAVLSQCNDGLVFSYNTGEVTQLLVNEGFETGGAKPTIATKWTYKVDDDGRVCNAVNPPGFSGQCAFRFKGKNNVTTNISQVYNYKPVGNDGDQVSIVAQVHGTNLAPGSTIRAIIKFQGQPKKNVKIDIPQGNYLGYQQLTSTPVDIVAPIKSVTFRITKVGKGTLLVDDVALLLAENATSPGALALASVPDANVSTSTSDLRGLD